MKKASILIGIATVLILAAGILFFPPIVSAPERPLGDDAAASIPDEAPATEAAVTIELVCVGDVMAHSTQYKAQYDSATKTYDFDENFQFVAPYILEADLAFFNLETVFAGGSPQGYPTFNAPDSLADALKKAGFDVALFSNNHILDQGTKGLKRTLEVLHRAGIGTSGAYNEGGSPFSLHYAGKVPIGVVAFTYETPSINGVGTLNGSPIPASARGLFNSFSYERLDEELLRIGDAIRQAREAGAAVVVCYFHWGEEYQREPGREQRRIAEAAAAAGADVIFASHPHVVQPVEVLENDQTGRKTAVFYSMGNFISNQRAETLDNRYTEQGIIARVSLSLLRSTGEITGYEASVVPLWVDRYKSERMHFAVIPLDSAYESNPALLASGHLPRARQALADLESLIGIGFIK